MAYNTVILQGSFISNGQAKTIPLESGVEWMEVWNYTQLGNGGAADVGAQYYWQLGMAQGTGIEYTNTTGALGCTTLASGGFTYTDTSSQNLGPVTSTITAISTAAIPVVTNTGTNGLSAGQIVRLSSVVGAPQFNGYLMTVGLSTLNSTHFSLDYMPQLAVAGTTGAFQVVPYPSYWYPTYSFITGMSQASQMVVSMSVANQYTVGQEVRLVVPAAFGMVQANLLQGQIVAVGANSITLNINSSGFSAFTFPLAAAVPFSPALVVPIGEGANGAVANPNLLDDATLNTAITGMTLGAGANGPAGSSSDVIYWKAGYSFSNSTS